MDDQKINNFLSWLYSNELFAFMFSYFSSLSKANKVQNIPREIIKWR